MRALVGGRQRGTDRQECSGRQWVAGARVANVPQGLWVSESVRRQGLWSLPSTTTTRRAARRPSKAPSCQASSRRDIGGIESVSRRGLSGREDSKTLVIIILNRATSLHFLSTTRTKRFRNHLLRGRQSSPEPRLCWGSCLHPRQGGPPWVAGRSKPRSAAARVPLDENTAVCRRLAHFVSTFYYLSSSHGHTQALPCQCSQWQVRESKEAELSFPRL
ncbi:hypothetical protein E2C01_037502 [Portunus trituberculatus]|uniref:Uncharacterized protein n=1 Tax=Portunus trituberculatus TaxID=210409 RepID=A0A5B7FF43_PORTR|nr:hypothetical protein [Portunus trituberculatus]